MNKKDIKNNGIARYFTLRRGLLVLGAVLFLQGCGIKFWYNRLDWVVPWYVDDYVELTSSQETRLEELMVTKTRWHRSQELPRYIEWLEHLSRDIEQGSVAANYEAHNEQMRDFFRTLLEEVGLEVVAIMTELSDQQVEELLETLADNDAEYLEDYREESEQERIEDRTENIEDSLKEWIGRLTQEQKGMVAQWAMSLKSTTEERMAYRARWQNALATTLENRADESGEAAVKQLFRGFEQYQSEQLKAAYAHNREVNKAYLLELYETLTDKQKKRMLNRLNSYKEDFVELLDDD